MKNKINIKLVNLVLILLVVFLIYKTGNLWVGIINILVEIFLPFLFSFAIAYAIYPFLKLMVDKCIPKWISVIIIIFIFLSILSIITYLTITIAWDQLYILFNNIITFINNLEDVNLVGLENNLKIYFSDLLTRFGNIVSDGAINIVNFSIAAFTKLFIVIAAFIYFLIDMDKIRNVIKNFFSHKRKKTYEYIKALDCEMKNYLNGLVQIMLITLIEYTLGYTLIGHPNAILLGFLASFGNLMPLFGGIIVNVIAFITAIVISKTLIVKTIVLFLILSLIDSYIINPTIYGRTNKIHPIITIIATFAGGILFGTVGIIISFPVTIIIITTYKYYKKDINYRFQKK